MIFKYFDIGVFFAFFDESAFDFGTGDISGMEDAPFQVHRCNRDRRGW